MPGSSTLSGGITSSSPSFTLASGSSFPTSGFQVLIGTEKIRVSGRSGNVCTVDTMRSGGRGINGTPAAAHLNGDAVTEVTVTPEMAVREGEVLRTYDKRTPHPQHRKRKLRDARF